MLRGPRLPHAVDGHHVDEFDLAAGEELTFSTTWVRSWRELPEPLPFDDRIEATRVEHERVGGRVPRRRPPRRPRTPQPAHPAAADPRRDRRHRRGADHVSLPEDFGGERNWDYRFCWLRDAALTLESLLAAGYTDEARDWRNWLLRAVAGDPEDLQIMYTVDGGRQLPERELDHLPGYAGLAAGAHRQRRGRPAPDRRARRGDDRARGRPQRRHRRDAQSWALQRALVDELAEHWDEPDNGLWEIRGAAAALHALPGDGVGRLRPRRSGPSRSTASPARSSAGATLRDAGPRRDPGQGLRRRARHLHPALRHHARSTPRLLNIPLVGFLPGDDARVLGTIRGDRGGPDAPRASCCATAPRPASTAWPATSTRSWPAPSGWSRPTPAPAASTTPTR